MYDSHNLNRHNLKVKFRSFECGSLHFSTQNCTFIKNILISYHTFSHEDIFGKVKIFHSIFLEFYI